MGLYEDSESHREMYWQQYGPCSEDAYDPSCDPSPTMPHLDHASHPAHSASLSPSGTSQPPFGSDRSTYLSPRSDAGSTEVGSPGGQRSSSCGFQDSSSYSVANTTTTSSSICSSTGVNNGGGTPCPEVSFCAGCSGRIIDRFYLLAVERKWHAACLRCSVCHTPLDTAGTCFAKDGHIFCREDYHRLFNMRRCARCGQGINSAELVMRARDFVYHVQCFTCAHCNMQLTKGDQFGMSGPLIYCRDHYQMSNPLEAGHLSPLAIPPGVFSLPHIPPDGFPPSEHVNKIQYFNGVGAPHKGRPRKRKPKDEPMDTNMNIPNSYDLEGAYGAMGNPCQPVRTKRIRTSFKHHQLRAMKAYFLVNHNPDAKDLKQLSQKTGLSKRVLQVWFQNARAKWRRQTLSKDPKSMMSTPGGNEPTGTGASQDNQNGGDSACSDFDPNTPGGVVTPLTPDDVEGRGGSTSGENSQLYQQMF